MKLEKPFYVGDSMITNKTIVKIKIENIYYFRENGGTYENEYEKDH